MPGSIEEIRLVFKELERHMFDVVSGVQDGHEIRTTAFQKAEEFSKQLTALLKGHELLPRYIMLGLSQAATILQNEASHMRSLAEQGEAVRMANAIQFTSDLILRGECHADRRPGIPRVI